MISLSNGKRPCLYNYQPGDEYIGCAITFDDAAQATAKHNTVHIDRKLCANRRYANKTTYPSQRQRICSLPEDLGYSRALQRAMNTRGPDLMDTLDGVALGRIDSMGST